MLNKKIMSSFEIFTLVFSIIAFTSLISFPVSAAEMTDGEMVDMRSSNPTNSQNSFLPNPDAEEQIGCCVDTSEGTCSATSEKTACEAEDNTLWYEDSFCNLDGGICNKGCCKIGANNIWITETECAKQSELAGIVSDFDTGVAGELECRKISTENNLGACVYALGFENTCTFTSSAECDSIGGNFKSGRLCSSEALNTSCVKQDHIGCLEGRDGIYWYDSCGNPENIYSSDKDTSWNNGEILSPSQSCNPTSSNSNSDSCGNCDYNDGSTCKEAILPTDKKMRDGDFTCRDLNCEDAPIRVDARGKVLEKRDKTNGESWCVYDGPIGGLGLFGGELALFSQDLVGSRHYRYICSNGEIEVDAAQDYRKEICVEKTDSNGKTTAANRVNTWEQCIGANQNGECGPICLTRCVANPDCRVQVTRVAENFGFQTCVPKYPPGFESAGFDGILSGLADNALGELGRVGDIIDTAGDVFGGGGTSSGDVCSLASKTCVSTWVKTCNPVPVWKCINNCACHTPSFTMQMNNLCVSLGDCGVYSNLMGKPIFSGADVDKKGRHGIEPIDPRVLGIAYMALSFLPSRRPAVGGGFDKPSDILGLSSGRLGGIIGIVDPFLGNIISGFGGDYGEGFEGGSQFGNLARSVGAWGTAAAAGGALNFIAGQISTSLYTSLYLTPMGFFFVAAAVLAAMYAMGCGKVEQVEIEFTCSASGPPIGADCDSCNGGSLKPCSKYKCQSLGAACQLINENTGVDECVKMEGIDKIPIITPFEEALNQTLFQYTDISDNGFRIREANGDCVSAFSIFSFGVLTENVPSICAISEEPVEFIEMKDGFLEGNIFTRNHTMIMSLPSVESIIYTSIGNGEGEDSEDFQEVYDEIYNTAEERMADLNIYVKCINPFGDETEAEYKINTCVKPGPDLMPPVIMATAPATETVVGFGITSQEATFYTNEPVDCRWGKTNPGLANSLDNYNFLENEMNCETTSRDTAKGFYPCKTTLSITNKSNDFYVLCRDQPWLGENESRNIGATEGNPYKYILRVSQSKLKIESIKPEGKRIAGTEPVTVELSATTSGGGYNGAATCGYELNSEDPANHVYITFLNTGSAVHSQPGLQFLSGTHTIDVNCFDDAGNTANGTTEINLELDTTAPTVTRIFNQAGLTITTDEEAECYYNLETCNFNIDSGESMTTGLSTTHKADWNPASTYFVKCKDIWENKASGCSIIVRPSQL